MGAAILAVNAGALVALAYPLTAPRVARAARKVAKATNRCCGPEVALLLSCTWPCASAPFRPERRGRGGCGAADACISAARGLGSWGQLWWRSFFGRRAAQQAEGVTSNGVPPAWGRAVGRTEAVAGVGGGGGDSSAVGLGLSTSAGLAPRPQQFGSGGVALTLHGCPSARQGGLQGP